ncbi:hypothetical protein POV27_07195 [Aureisphaera galaxeae]|uniref:hypothetical protein n=1 Tax=Aureisphaera galaxeae TaxID=1538023 RepID=UPI002350C7A9|nr:hypothetical protein [Aureisphaera galaxeae]MDC8003831.1 hypothetical protein [Aureisphaera galaxeae]
MKAASVAQLKKELKFRSSDELEALCLRLARFKKENKELLTYLLFESEDEAGYVDTVKEQMDEGFEAINTTSFYYVKKSIRKILRETKKYIRYSNHKETEIELLLHFCHKLKSFSPSIKRSRTMMNLYDRQVALIEKKVLGLHEDLQYDYALELEKIKY